MFRVVAIIALVAAIGPVIVQYSDERLQLMNLYSPTARRMTASVINAGVKRGVGKTVTQRKDSVVLVSYNLEDGQGGEGEGHRICKDILGIDLNNGQSFFCDLDGMEMTATKIGTQHYLTLRMYFGILQDTPLVMDIPIFSRPHQYDYKGYDADLERSFEEYATTNVLGTSTPLTKNGCKLLSDGDHIGSTFNWLKDLLALGVYKRSIQLGCVVKGNDYKDVSKDVKKDAETLVTRPIVLPEEDTNKLYHLIYTEKEESQESWPHLPSAYAR